MLGYMHALLLLIGASPHQLIDVNERTTPQWAEIKGLKGQPTTAELFQQRAAPPQAQPATASPLAAPPTAAEPMVSASAWLPADIFYSAQRGELQKVVQWLSERGAVDALYSLPTGDGHTAIVALLHLAATGGHLEMVRELLKRGASIDLPTSFGSTPLMQAAHHGHPSVLLVLLQHSANPNLQDPNGVTALMLAANQGHQACVQALLRAKANTKLLEGKGHTALQWAESQGHTATAELIRQHAAPPPVVASPRRTRPPASLPVQIFVSAERGELQRVVKWLGTGGPADAFGSAPTADGRLATATLLHIAAANDHLEMVRELLKRGASVDLPSSLGITALMGAAIHGHLSTLLVLLQHSANPDLQDTHGHTALMGAALSGQEACVQALLRAKASTELLDTNGRTALQWAEIRGYTAIAQLLRQHASCLSLGLALCAALPPTWSWLMLSLVLLGTIATVAFSRTPTARPGQQQPAARQRRPHRTARHTKAQGRATTEQPIRQQHATRPQPAATVAPHTMRAEKAAQAAREDRAVEDAPVEKAAKQARSQKSEKKTKAGRAAANGDEPSEAPPPVGPAPPPAASPRPATSAAKRAKAALQAAIAGGGLSALEAALAAAPHEVRESRVGTEARVWRESLLEAQQKAEREAQQEAAAGAARLAAAERGREVAARAAAASNAREEAVAAVAKADALERARVAGGGEGGSSKAAGPRSGASEEAEMPVDDYVCPITAEVMADPVSTMDGFTFVSGDGFTFTALKSKALVSNHSLRSMIRSFAEEFDSGEFARV